MDWALKLVVLVAVPAALALLVLSGPLLATLFHYGKFNSFDVRMAQESLRMFAIGLPFFIAVKILITAFFSRQDTKTPVKIAMVALLVNIVGNCILIGPLAHAGIALATSLGALINVSLLILVLKHQKIFIAQKGWLRVGLTLLIGCGLMVFLLLWLQAPIQDWLHWDIAQRIWHLLGLVMSGLVVYLIAMFGFCRKILRASV